MTCCGGILIRRGAARGMDIFPESEVMEMRLTERVYLVGSGSMGFSLTDPYDCHVYLLDGGSELALIDVGAGMGVPEILANVRAHGFDPARIRHLILTHAHGDHGGGAAPLRAARGNGPEIYLHQDSAAFLREGDEKAISLTFAREIGLYPPDYRLQPCPVDVELAEGQRLPVGDLELEVLDTPGHCTGHTSFVLRHGGRTYLFGGDLVFFGGRILLQNIYDCDLQAHVASLMKVATLAVDVFLPGHVTLSLKDGQRHIDAAVRYVKSGLIPPNLTYAWA
jgi:glyoxylase-like metal-dependent hydrolase (beta-lactamase superfamily II)